MAAQQLNLGPPLEFGDVNAVGKKGSANDKRLSVERIYQKKTQLEHILLRPDTYIGSVEFVTQNMWVYDGEDVGMVLREITYVPGLYKIFDEILVNAADNKQRDKNMDCIKVDIDPENNKISIWNNGQGIPVVEHKVEKMYVPSLIFGQLLTSSNYNDEEKKVTGGRNGYGAKLCNIFSKKFIVETSSKSNKSCFKQTWQDNMTKSTDAKIGPKAENDFTKITFYPDLSKFKMDVLDKDIVALMSRRAYDIAGTTRGVKVFLNGKKLPVKGFKDYIEQYLRGKEDEQGNPLKVVFESVSDRWEVGVTHSEKGFQQISFVNSIATTKGGRHTDHVTDQMVSKIAESVKKRNKGGVAVKPFQIKNHMWVFVNCLIENPTFDSQTKENMTLQMKSFGSKCTMTDKFFVQVVKCGIVDSVMSWIKFKAEIQLNKKCHSTKHSKLKGIPKLEDANDAGTKNSIDCTLILTEGDSAKTLAVSGLGVIGRDKYGVFPLKGKILNVREASHKQILENAEINNVIKIMGLQYKKKYETMDDLRSLRYGRLMIMTDQDQDGSHIKGLLINFIHHNWPSLLRLPFLEEFITPIVKASKGKDERSFYSLPEFEEWKAETGNWNLWKIKYYKGLGTSTSAEAKEYFSDMVRHRIKFKYQGSEDDGAIHLAFSKKMIEQRKEWLTNGMDERKRRRELGLPEVYLYAKDTKQVTYNDFVNKELILFSNMDNERSIPSLVDGFKPGQRKVMFTCLKRNDKREVKVAQLAGSVAEKSAYHHGEVSLMGTIVNLAQNYIGSNNINLLQPIGQFGTRLQGGKDSASPRYIFTMLSPLAKMIINPKDEPLLRKLYDDNQPIEPEYFVPLLPMVLVNGAEGIGTGWSTKIPNYNPREIVANLRRMMDGEDPKPMIPWFKNFRGTIEQLDNQRFVVNGEASILGNTKLEITELPIRTWTQAYKESVLEVMLHGTDKIPAAISDFKEYNTDATVRFVVFMSEEKLAKAEEQGLHKLFKLQSTISTTSMVLFDSNGCLRRYDSPEEILQEFFALRLSLYEKRKKYLEGELKAEANKLSNQARFILEKCDNVLVIENKKKADMIRTLTERGYDMDPVVTWKKSVKAERLEVEINPNSEDEEEEESSGSTADYNYLLGMTMWHLTKEKKDELLKKRDEKKSELEVLRLKSPSDLWEEDLTVFMTELDRVEAKELEDLHSGKIVTKAAGKQGAGKRPRKQVAVEETQPSPVGQKVVPKIDPELRKKIRDPAKEGRKRAAKALKLKNEDDPDPAPLSDRIGISPDKLEASISKKKVLKQAKLTFKNGSSVTKSSPIKSSPGKGTPKKGKGKRKNPWSSDSETGSEEEGSESEGGVASDDSFKAAAAALAREPTLPRRATAVQKKYTYESDNDSEQVVEDEELLPNFLLSDNESPATKNNNYLPSDDGNDSPAIKEEPSPVPIPKKPSKKKETAPSKSKANDNKPKGKSNAITLSDSEDDADKALNGAGHDVPSDSDDSFTINPKKRAAPALKPAEEENTDALFDSLLSSGGNNISSAPPAIGMAPAQIVIKRPVSDSDDTNSSVEMSAPPKKITTKPPPATKAAPKRQKKAPAQNKRPRKKASDTDASDDDDFPLPKPKKTAQARKGASDDSEEELSDGVAVMGRGAPLGALGGGGRARPARAKAPISYNIGGDSSNNESDF